MAPMDASDNWFCIKLIVMQIFFFFIGNVIYVNVVTDLV